MPAKWMRRILTVCGVLGIIVGITYHQFRETMWALNATGFMWMYYTHQLDEERYRV